jgi:carboxylesterase
VTRERPHPDRARLGEFRFDGGSRGGVLLVHGFTGSPHEMLGLGEALARRGFTAVGVRLPGHGDAPAGEANDAPAWRAAIDSGLAALAPAAAGRPIVAAGLSMGALLVLDLALRRAGEVASLVALSPAIELRMAARAALWVARRSTAIRARYALLEKGESDIQDPIARATHPKSPPYSVDAALSLVELQAQVVASLPRITHPLLIVHSRRDRTCPIRGAERLARMYGGSAIEKHVLEKSGHVITVDLERESAERLVIEFVERTAASGDGPP